MLGLTVVAAPALGSDDSSETASFTIDAVDVPAEGEAGNQITVTADITNTGDADGETTVSFDVGESTAQTNLTLGAGASKTVSLDVSLPEDRGDYDWTLAGGNDQTSGTLSVLGPEIVLNEVIVPSEAEPGEVVAFDMDITNTGELTGSVDISVEFDGTEVDSGAVEFAAGENSIVFVEEAMPDAAGTYDWTVTVGDQTRSGEIEVVGPEFVVDAVYGPETLEAGESVALDLEITNTGPIYGEQDVSLEIAGEDVFSGTYGLYSDETGVITVDAVMPAEPGTYELVATAGNDSYTTEIDVAGAEFVVNDVSGPGTVEPGATVTFGIDITNEGDLAGSKEVSFAFDGETVGSDTLGFDPGENSIVEVEVAIPEEPGTYDWTASAGGDTYTGETTVEGTEPPAFSLDSVSVPASGDAGQGVTVEATVSNTGDKSGETTVTFDLGGQQYDTTVSLDSGASQTVSFDVTLPDEGGNYDWTMAVGDAAETGSIDVAAKEDDPAAFSLDDVSAPSSGDAGAAVTVEATVWNTGDESGETTVSFDLAGQRYDTTVSLDGGDSQTVTLDAALPDEGGDYDWTLAVGDDTDTGSLRVAEDDAPAAFTFEDISVPSSGDTGESITVEATVSNTGDEAGDTAVEFNLGGNSYETTVSLDGGGSKTVTLDAVLPDDDGEYDWALSTDDDTEIGSVEVGDGADAETPEFVIDAVDYPTEVTAGDQFTVEATLVNEGSGGEEVVTFSFAGETIRNQTLSLRAGEQTTLEFGLVAPEQEGDTSWMLATDAKRDSGEIAVKNEPAAFEIESVGLPSEGDAGRFISVDVEVENVGEEKATKSVTLQLDGTNVSTDDLTLPGRADESVNFDMSLPETGGTYDFTVVVGDDSVTETIEVTGNDPEYVIDGVDAPTAAELGEELTITPGITNEGGEAGDFRLKLTVDGEVVGTKRVSLDNGESITPSFDVAMPKKEGTYEWAVTIDGTEKTGTIEVQQAVDTARLSLEDATIETDETTSIALTATAQDLASYDLSVTFDPDVVSVVEVSDGDIGGVSAEIDNENGIVDLTGARESGVDDPVLATIEFTTATTDDGTTDLTFGNSPSVFSGETETFEVKTGAGTITVEGTVQCEPGDADGDGEMTIADATLIQQYVVDQETGSAFEPRCADLTGDGEVTTADVIAAMNQVAEIDE